MSKITITRSNGWIGAAAINNIYIDGEKAGIVSAGTPMHFDVTPGKHTVKAKSGLVGGSRLIEVEVGESENKTIQLSPVKYINMAPAYMPFILALIIYLISLIFDIDIKFMYFMYGFLVLYLLYFFTFGRDTFWKLKEM